MPTTSFSLTPDLSAQSQQAILKDRALRKAAVDLEASFLAEMLKSAGLGKTREGFGSGGAGEDQFSGMLVRAQAEEMARAGGIGLAESIYNSLKETEK